MHGTSSAIIKYNWVFRLAEWLPYWNEERISQYKVPDFQNDD